MPVCENCGVEIEDIYDICPLCGIPRDNTEVKVVQKQPKPVRKQKKTNYLWLLELLSFFSLAGIMVVLAVDLAYGINLSWSYIPLVSIIFTWVFFLILFYFSRKPYKLVTIEVINTLIFLQLLDFFTPKHTWFLKLALPLILILGIIILLVILWIRTFKLKVLPAISVATFAIGVFLIFLDLILHLFHDLFTISWSLVAFACLLPFSGFLLYLQYRLKKKGSDLPKILHL